MAKCHLFFGSAKRTHPCHHVPTGDGVQQEEENGHDKENDYHGIGSFMCNQKEKSHTSIEIFMGWFVTPFPS
jgi:hypothetical protein